MHDSKDVTTPPATDSNLSAALRLEGSIERVIYHEPRTGYGVYRVLVEAEREPVVVVAKGRRRDVGATVQATGAWTRHPTHGRQFDAHDFREVESKAPEAVFRRLIQYPGIGEQTAQRILETLGVDALEHLSTRPNSWLTVDGIGERTLARVLEYHRTRSGPLAALEDRLVAADLPIRFAEMLHRQYGERAMGMLEHHPYQIAREVKGVGFVSADAFARAMGFESDDPQRLEAGVLYVLSKSRNDGHCALPQRELMRRASQILGVPGASVVDAVDRLVATGELVEQTDGEELLYFEYDTWLAELQVAQSLRDLVNTSRPTWTVVEMPAHLSDGQKQAVTALATHGVVIMTGGPGTGKSTVVHEVLELAAENGEDVYLAAPTGRAAKRLEQTTNASAKTLHRLLEIQADSGAFFYNANNPLPDGLVVVDEASMLDLQLASALLGALGPGHRLLLVGDADQLPSVGPGNVLFDLLRVFDHPGASVPVVRLTQIFRQAEGSTIVLNAHRVLSGGIPESDDQPAGEFFVVRSSAAEKARDLAIKMIVERIPKVYGLDPIASVQVLCPMHRGVAGIRAFNDLLQDELTGDADTLEIPGVRADQAKRFRVGDRVMQTRNDYERNVFNGDIGIVRMIHPSDRALSVEIDGALVRYEGAQFGALQLAYAVSIHKSQGSEFPAVVIPVLSEHRVMLRRNLLYTAMTRAVRLCILVGDSRAIELAVQNADAQRRFTGLQGRLREAFGG